jgi:hypothetical protein
MVWNQYIWEATTGNEADISDDEESQVQQPVHIDDWIDFNSEEINYLWAIIREYCYDAYTTNFLQNMTSEDLARFCYDPPMYFEGDSNTDRWIEENSEKLRYIWKLVRKSKSSLILHTNYEDFAFFCYTSR